MNDSENFIQTALDAGALAANVRTVGPDSAPFVTLPLNHKVTTLEFMLPAPLRPKGNTTLNDVGSFIMLVNALKNSATRLYGNLLNPSFKAVFNDTSCPALPGWGDHTATYLCPLSAEWILWNKSSGLKMTQEQFAQFIEDNLPDLVAPPAAEMLEISRSLEAKKKVDFSSGVRLANGANELTYTEEISGTAGKGRFTVPEEFTIGIPVLEGGARYSVTSRLRYRITEGKLTMWHELIRPQKVLEHAVNETRTLIQEQTGLPFFNGSLGG